MSETLTLAAAFLWMRVLACLCGNIQKRKIQRQNLADTESANGLMWAVCDANRMLIIIVLGAPKWQISYTEWMISGSFWDQSIHHNACPFIRRQIKWPCYQCTPASQLFDAALAALWTLGSLILWMMWVLTPVETTWKKRITGKVLMDFGVYSRVIKWNSSLSFYWELLCVGTMFSAVKGMQ